MKVRTEARRSAILTAAVELFKEKGYGRASMNELARRYGGSKATLYGYFPSKEALFVAVVKAVATAHLSEAVAEISGDAGKHALEDLLVSFGKRMMVVLTNDASALAVYRMVVGEASHHAEVGQLFSESGPAQLGESVTTLFKGAIERGELRCSDPKILAAHFMALLTAETSSRIYEFEPRPMALEEIHAMVRRAVEAFLLGAAPRTGRQGPKSG